MNRREAEQQDAAYRAIGRYVVEFSSLVWLMRSLVEDRLTGPLAGETADDEHGDRALAELVLGEATAQPIANVLFGMCRMAANLDPAETQVANALSDRVNKTIETRNDIAHGDWVAYFPNTPPWLTRVRPARKIPLKYTEYAPETLDGLSDNLRKLRQLVSDYGRLALGLWMLCRDSEDAEFRDCRRGELRVGDVLIKRGTKVLREGPKANLVMISDL